MHFLSLNLAQLFFGIVIISIIPSIKKGKQIRNLLLCNEKQFDLTIIRTLISKKLFEGSTLNELTVFRSFDYLLNFITKPLS